MPQPHPAYHTEVLAGIDELPDGLWQKLAPDDDPMWSRGVFTALEHSSVGPDGYAYLVLRRAGEVTAVLPLCLFRKLRLDEVAGARERQLLAPLSRFLPRLLRVPMLFCGNLLGQGHVLSAGPLDEAAGRVLVAAVLDFARRERLGTVVFKDFPRAELEELRPALARHGFFAARGLPDTEIALGQGSFEKYLTGLDARQRRNARSKIRAFDRTGLRLEVLDDFGHLLPELLSLYRQVMDRANVRLDVLDADFFAAMQGGDGLRRRLVVCFEGERPVAFLLCLFAGSGAIGARIGLDYRLAHEARLYHNVHYEAIRLAIASGCRQIGFAQNSYQPKLELGCELVGLWHAVTHLRPSRRVLLRRLLPPVLDSALTTALGPHADHPIVDRPQHPGPHDHDKERPPHATS